MTDIQDIENRATLSRATCGWKQAHLSVDEAREYLRDVHGPAIARRAGIHEYRHFWMDEVRTDLFAPVEGIRQDCEPDAKLMWISDVRYLDEAALARSGASPDPVNRQHILEDINLIIQTSSTYRSVNENTVTLADSTGIAAPQGPVVVPSYQVLLRQRGEDREGFRALVRRMAMNWAVAPGVRRVRLNLFEELNMEAERAAGYPVKTHPPAQQYQAWIDLSVDNDAAVSGLMSGGDGIPYARHIHTLHAYAVRHLYTPIYAGRPTLVGLRGYQAWCLIKARKALNQEQPSLLQWMYGPVVQEGPCA